MRDRRPSDLSLALNRAAEHALSMRDMLAGIPSSTRLPGSRHTVGDLLQLLSGLGWQISEAHRLVEEASPLMTLLGLSPAKPGTPEMLREVGRRAMEALGKAK